MSLIPAPAPETAADYQIYILKDDGTNLATITRPLLGGPRRQLITETTGGFVAGSNSANVAVAFSYTQVINNLGRFRLTLPGDFDRNVLRKDNRVIIWRKPPGGARSLAFMGFIRRVRTRTDAAGNTTRTVYGYDLNYLLSGRVVAYYAGHARAEMTDQADDLIKAFVSYNLGANATTGNGRKATASISATYFSIEADAAAGVSQTKGASYRTVLDVCREVADAARADGTEVYFGIVPVTDATFQLRTRTGQWGRDRTVSGSNGLIFSLPRGNLAEPDLDEDASEEVNYVYALGQGEGSVRTIQTASDTTRIGQSIFALREGKIDARQFSTSAGVTDAANAALVKGRPINTFTAKLLSVPGSIYGRDWGFGDRVTVSYDGRQFSALVRALTVSVDENGLETLDSTVEAYGL